MTRLVKATLAVVLFFAFVLLISRAWDHERATGVPRAEFDQVVASLQSDLQRHEGQLKLTRREVAVLLCSHHWTDEDARIVVHHERPSEVAWCIHSYNTTGRIP